MDLNTMLKNATDGAMMAAILKSVAMKAGMKGGRAMLEEVATLPLNVRAMVSPAAAAWIVMPVASTMIAGNKDRALANKGKDHNSASAKVYLKDMVSADSVYFAALLIAAMALQQNDDIESMCRNDFPDGSDARHLALRDFRTIFGRDPVGLIDDMDPAKD